MARPCRAFINIIIDLPTDPPCLSASTFRELDLRTWPPSRWHSDIEEADFSYEDSSVSLSRLLVNLRNYIYLINIHGLWSSAFTTTRARGRSLEDVLQTSTILKVCFDVGKSLGALFAHLVVVLDGIQDIRLMNQAACQRLQRSYRHRYLHSLERCINWDAQMSAAEEQAWIYQLDLILQR